MSHAGLESVELGTSGIRVSEVGLGTWAIGGWLWGGTDEKESVETIRSAIDRGIRLIDTAPVYGFGKSEEIVGRALAESGLRRQVVLATKVGLEWTADGRVFRNSTRKRIFAEIEDSLRRLGTDTVDLYQVHWPDPQVPIAETAQAMADLLKQGKIRAIGVSNYSPAQMDEFRKHAPLHSVQPPYNLFERQIDQDVLPYALKNKIAVLGYGAICRGLLSGRMDSKTTFTGDDVRRSDPKFQPPRFEQYLAAVEALRGLAARRKKSVLALAIRWVLDRGVIALWGARHPRQLDPIREIPGWSLGLADLAEVDEILKKYVRDPVDPEFMAPPPR